MQVGIRAYEDNVEEMAKLDADYFEIRVTPPYSVDGRQVPATKIEAFDRIKDKVIIIHGAIQDQVVNLMNRARNDNNVKALEKALDAADRFENCRYVVMHPGRVEKGYKEHCSLAYLYKLMQMYDDPRLCLEIIPVFSREPRDVFPMHSVDDFKRLQDKTKKKLVLDIFQKLGLGIIIAFWQKLFRREF